MIPILTIIVAICAGIAVVGGIILFILRRRGERLSSTPDQQETQRILNDVFGNNMRWGGAGGVEAEMHDHGNHNTHTDSHSSDASGGDSGGGGGGD